MRAVVLLSGGADSATCLALARARRREVYAISFDYGQRHRVELGFARRLARRFGCVEHRVVRVDLPAGNRSALTSRKVAVPKRGLRPRRIPVTYVPARNTLFLALALGLAEVVGAQDLYIGVNAVDYSGYPDCRPEFIRAFESLANLATKAGVEGARFKIHAPLSGMTKAEIIREGTRLGVDYGMTHSCYDPDGQGRACGRCDSCLLRKKGFQEAGVPDPTLYTEGK